MKKNRKQEEWRSCQSQSSFIGFNISFSCTHLNLLPLTCCQWMPARCHFNSGFPACDRGAEGQITNSKLTLMGLNINPDSLKIHPTAESFGRADHVYQSLPHIPHTPFLVIMYYIVGDKLHENLLLVDMVV